MLVDERITLGDIDFITKNKRRFKSLLTACGLRDRLPPKTLRQRREHLEQFETRVTRLQTFVNIFCSPLHVALGSLPSELLRIRAKWDGLAIGAVWPLFTELPIVPHLVFLYELRASELFLTTWSTLGRSKHALVGKSSASASAPPAPPMPEWGDENDHRSIDLSLFTEQSDMEAAAAAHIEEDDDDDDEGTTHRARSGVFTIEELVVYLLPVVKKRWAEIYGALDRCDMKFPEISKLFGRTAADHLRHEVELLYRTGLGEVVHTAESATTAPWVDDRTAMLSNFLLLYSHTRRITSLLAMLSQLAPLLFDTDENEGFEGDELYAALTSCDRTFAAEWDTQTLADARRFVAPVKEIFAEFTTFQLDFFDEFCRSQKLIGWLVKHADTHAFNRLINICKANTEDAVALKAIASLLSTRNLLSRVLYPTEKFSALKDFLSEFHRLEVASDNEVSHLRTANEQFGALLNLFAEKTLSPGMQAVVKLQEIMRSGVYIWKSTGTAFDIDADVQAERTRRERARKSLTASGNLARLPASDANLSGGDFYVAFEAHQATTSSTAPMTSDELIDLRNRLMLAEISEERLAAFAGATAGEATAAAEGPTFGSLMELFVEQLKVLLEIAAALKRLSGEGHFEFQRHDERFPSTVAIATLKARSEQLRAMLDTWRDIVRTSRERFYFLNFFSISQILRLTRLLDTALNMHTRKPVPPAGAMPSILGKIRNHLRFVCTDLRTADFVDILLAKWVDTDTLKTPSEKLELFGAFLDAVFAKRMPVTRIVSKEIVAKGSMYLFEQQEHTRGPFVVVTDSPNKVFDLITTIYVQKGRLPEPDEVLLCRPATTIDDIELVLRRWATAAKHGRADRLFVLGNIQELSYAVQSQTAERALSLWTSAPGDCSTLVCISGRADVEGQHMVNALHSRKLEMLPLDEPALRQLYADAMKKYCRDLCVFVSSRCGAGKSHAIRRAVASGKLCYRHIPVNGHIDADQFISLFTEDPLFAADESGAEMVDPADEQAEDERVAFHIDIGPTATAELNGQLFELVILGMLHDSTSGRVYHRRPQDVIYMEIANSFNDATLKRMHFPKMLPTQTIVVAQDTVDMFKYELRIDESEAATGRRRRRLRYGAVPNYELQFVAKFLRAFQDDRFTNFQAADVDFHPDLEPEIEPQEVFTLLATYFPALDVASSTTAAGSGLSWALLNNFVQFLYYQFLHVTQYELLTNIAVAGALGRPDFKGWIIDFIIKTSVDFSTRSVALPPEEPSKTAAGSTSIGGDELTSHEMANYAEMFEKMKQWSDSDHPYVFFNQADPLLSGLLPAGIGILSLDPTAVDRSMESELKQILVLNGFNFSKDYSKMTREEALATLGSILGVADPLARGTLDADYVLTIDNVMKILSIQLRVKFGIPVVVIGDTGCGKTALVRFLCRFIGAKLFHLRVHGGVNDDVIVQWMLQGPIPEALKHPTTDIYVFFDEVNTCASLSLFKNLLCDRFLQGKRIPDNIKLLAAANPYRRVPEHLLRELRDEMSGLVFEHHHSNATGATAAADPLRFLIYRVHPMPQTLLDYVWDFGSLDSPVERLYIEAIIKSRVRFTERDMEREYPTFVRRFTEVLSASHDFMRDNTAQLVSLRDVQRCVTLFNFFLRENTFGTLSTLSNRDARIRHALVLSLAVCYHSRLDKKLRKLYRMRATNVLHLRKGEFKAILVREMTFYAEQLALSASSTSSSSAVAANDAGIALNEALCENVFMILVCVLNRLPIMVVGKPGSSKSLAVELIASNLHGKTSANPHSRELPAIEIFSYQCSPLSDSAGIEQTFRHASRYQSSTSNTRVVVLLDEVGLAEQSPHLPLKVLHALLEEPDIAVVGISNWTLDAAKMNRAIFLRRPEPSVKDLKLTASAIVSGRATRSSTSVSTASASTTGPTGTSGTASTTHLESSLQALAEAYHAVYVAQPKRDFFGLRDFYHLIKFLHREMRNSPAGAAVLTPQLLYMAIIRNFGGRPNDLQDILRAFFTRVGMSLSTAVIADTGVLDLISANLRDEQARHLMLLTSRNDAALHILFDQKLLDFHRTVTIFGSDFPEDRSSDLAICRDIQTIKACMADGRSVALLHSENLYEALYDVLNQHYTIYGNQRFVRIALGSHSRLVPVHPRFRIVVVVDADAAYHSLAPPLLNRFEKQVLRRTDLLSGRAPRASLLREVVRKLSRFVGDFVNPSNAVGTRHSPSEAFVGYHDDTLTSLVISLNDDADPAAAPSAAADDNAVPTERSDEITLFRRAVQRLLWVTTPESVVRANRLCLSKYGFDDFEKLYFEEQMHTSLPQLLDLCLDEPSSLRDIRQQIAQLISAKSAIDSQLAAPTNEQPPSASAPASASVTEPQPQPQPPVPALQRAEAEAALKHISEQLEYLQRKEKELSSARQRSIGTVGDSIGALLMIMTFAPVSSDVRGMLASRISGKPRSYVASPPVVLKLHEFTAESELTAEITRFFNEQPEVEGLLVIQADPAAASAQRIQHARVICERERTGFAVKMQGKNTAKKHLVFLVHLTRSNSAVFTFDFDRRWRHVLLDELAGTANEGRDGTLGVSEMLKNSQLQLLGQLELRAQLSRNFRSGLARLVYPGERTAGEIVGQIDMLQRLLGDTDFMTALARRLRPLLERAVEESTGAAGGLPWQLAVASNPREIAVAGSFREALWQRLANTVLAVFTNTLAVLERNFNLQLYWRATADKSFAPAERADKIRRIFLRIFSDPALCPIAIHPVALQMASGRDTGGRIDVANDGKGRILRARFPFSHVFIRGIESLRAEAEKIVAGSAGVALVDATARLLTASFPGIFTPGAALASLIDSDSVDDYMHDYVMTKCGRTTVDVDSLWQIYRAVLRRQLSELTMADNTAACSMVAVHVAMWLSETRLFHTFFLLDLLGNRGLGNLVQRFLETGVRPLATNPKFGLAELDAALLAIVFDLLKPSALLWQQPTQRKDWALLIGEATVSVEALLRNVVGALSTSKTDLTATWRGLRLRRLFVRDVATNLDLDAAACLVFSANMADRPHYAAAAFTALLRYAEDRIASAANKPTAVIVLSEFVERYVTEFAFSVPMDAVLLEPSLLSEFVHILLERHASFVYPADADTPLTLSGIAAGAKLVATVALRAHIAANLVRLSTTGAPSAAATAACGLLHKLLGTLPHLDMPSCVLLVEAFEDNAAAPAGDNRKRLAAAVAAIDPVAVSKAPPLERLKAIGRARAVLSRLAADTAVAMETLAPIDNELVTQANRLLAAANAFGESARVFFARQLARKRGVAFAQKMLADSSAQATTAAANPFAGWVATWCATAKVRHFMSRQHLLPVDYFLLWKNEGYEAVRDAVRSALNGDITALQRWSTAANTPNPARGKVLLLLALFPEITLLYTANALNSVRSNASVVAVDKLVQRMAIQGTLRREEAALAHALINNRFVGDSAFLELPLTTAPDAADHLLMLSVAVHLAAVLVCTSSTRPLTVLHRLLLQPDGCSREFLPTMPADERQAVMAVLGGGWYECPNGHTYYVDACGRPTERLQCHVCGVTIGGIDHVLETTNKTADRSDRTAPGYVAGVATAPVTAADPLAAALANQYYTERALSPSAFRQLRILVHAALAMSSCIPGGHGTKTLLTAVATTTGSANTGVEGFLKTQLQADWRVLSSLLSVPQEDACLVLHLSIREFANAALSPSRPSPVFGEPITAQDLRTQCEAEFQRAFLNATANQSASEVAAQHYRRLAAGGSDISLIGELRETVPVDSYGTQRAVVLPTLWRFRGAAGRSANTDSSGATALAAALAAQFHALPQPERDRFPVLSRFLTDEAQLKALRHLRAVYEWQRLLVNRFERRVDREWARKTPVSAVLAEVAAGAREEASQWEAAFAGFAAAWNVAWRLVDRFVCMEIPPIFREMTMDHNTPVAFSLPDERDEGICPLSLTRFLVDAHNRFLDVALGTSAGTGGDVKLTLPLHLLDDSHVIDVGGVERGVALPTELLRAAAASKASLSYGRGGHVAFDFNKIERHLVDVLLAGKPFVTMEMRKFAFAGEVRTSGALPALRAKLPQTELPAEILQKIYSDLLAAGVAGSDGVRRCLGLLDLAIGFLGSAASDAAVDGSTPLVDFARQTLLLSEAESPFAGRGTILATHVQLRHVASLWQFLEAKVSADPFAEIMSKYKKPFTDPAMRQEVINAGARLPLNRLLPVMQEFVLNHLSEGSGGRIGEDFQLKDILGYCTITEESGAEGYLSGQPWFDQDFPSSPKMKHALTVLQLWSRTASTTEAQEEEGQ